MPRYHIQETVEDTNGDPLDAATVTVCVLGTTEKSRVPLYADANSATTLANPLTSDSDGLVDFYLAYPLVCDLRPVKAGVAGQTITVYPGLPDVGDVPTWDGREYTPQGSVVQTTGIIAVSAEEVASLHLTGKTLLVAQGANVVVLPYALLLHYLPNGPGYSGSATLALYYGDSGGAYAMTQSADDAGMNATDETLTTVLPQHAVFEGVGFSVGLLANRALVLAAQSPLADGEGSLRVELLYRTYDTAAAVTP